MGHDCEDMKGPLKSAWTISSMLSNQHAYVSSGTYPIFKRKAPQEKHKAQTDLFEKKKKGTKN